MNADEILAIQREVIESGVLDELTDEEVEENRAAIAFTLYNVLRANEEERKKIVEVVAIIP